MRENFLEIVGGGIRQHRDFFNLRRHKGRQLAGGFRCHITRARAEKIETDERGAACHGSFYRFPRFHPADFYLKRRHAAS
jgi:hypothetical protein